MKFRSRLRWFRWRCMGLRARIRRLIGCSHKNAYMVSSLHPVAEQLYVWCPDCGRKVDY